MSAIKKGGWTPWETDTLFDEAKLAGAEGRPIKSVFDRVASITGRKPNSIRNYYYLKIKEEGSPLSTTFVPFPKEETEELIHDMLKGQAEGRSVRSMAMEMGGGDKKLMLRYQNKYRSTIKNNEELTRSVMERMEQNGEKYFDPYSKEKNGDSGSVTGDMISLMMTCGKEGEAAIKSIYRLLLTAGECLPGEVSRLKRQLKEAESAKEAVAGELAREAIRNTQLENELKRFTAINRSFIDLSPIDRIGAMDDYIDTIREVCGVDQSK